MEIEQEIIQKSKTEPKVSVEQPRSKGENSHSDMQRRETLQKIKKVNESICRKQLCDLTEQDFNVIKNHVANLTRQIERVMEETDAITSYFTRLTSNLQKLEGLISGVDNVLRANVNGNESQEHQKRNTYADKLKSVAATNVML